MGRLNYANRKTEGSKLGQSIAKDIGKRIPPGTAYKAALRDPVVELDVTGKTLGQHGFLDMAGVLIKALEYDGEQGRVLYLEELCLKANNLNASCLPSLARIVRLTANELRDLDLSDNQILITSSQDADAWQDVLESFRECCVLRRVNLSGNALGPKAFEVLTRVYSREPVLDQLFEEDDIDTSSLDGTPSRASILGDAEALDRQIRSLSLGSAPETSSENTENTRAKGHRSVPENRNDSRSPEKFGHVGDADAFRRYMTTRGLRSIPYLILSETGMTDAGALHLSYLVSSHRHPAQLLKCVPPARSSHHIQQLELYDKESGCHGIVYLPNDSISAPGGRLLDLCEGARFSLLGVDPSVSSSEIVQSAFRKSSASRKTSLTPSSASTTPIGTRRRSGTKGEQDTLTDSEAVSAELDRARSRIQGNVLRDDGVLSHDLWKTALQMLSLCRTLCPLRREEPKARTPLTHQRKISEPADNIHFPSLPKAPPRPFVGYLDPFAPSPLATKSPNLPITPSPRAKKHPLKLKTATPSPLTITTSPNSPHVSPDTLDPHSKPYRSELPFGLPQDVWARIMGQRLQADRFLTRGQQLSVLRWGADRMTLTREMESLGKPESAQVWKVLDGMGCLAYEGDA